MPAEKTPARKWKVMLDPDFIVRHKLGGNQLRIYITLLGYKRAKDTCFPKRETLARDLGISVRSVDSNKAKLDEKQLTSWTQRKNTVWKARG